jgi:hypothetical protein
MNEIMLAMLEEAAGKSGISTEVMPSPAMTPEVESDAVRLSNLLSAEPVSSPSSVIKTETNSAASTHTLGDVIISRLDVIGTNYKNNVANVHALLEQPPGNLRLTDLLKVQLEMAAVSLEVELVGKSVSKTVQHIDQLSKLQ